MKIGQSGKEIKWIFKQSKQIYLYLLLFVIMSMMISACGVAFALASRSVIDSATNAHGSVLFRQCAYMLGVIIVQLMLQSIYSVMSTRASIFLEVRLKKHFFQTVLGRDWMEIGKYHSGDLMTRITSDISIVSDGILGIVPDIAALLTQLIGAFCVLFTLDASFAVIVLAISPAAVLFGKYYSKKTKKYHILCQESDAKARSLIQEALQNLLIIKVFDNEDKSIEDLGDVLGENSRIRMKRNNFGVFAGMGLSLSFWGGYFFAIAWGAYRLSAGFITFGTLTAFLQLVSQIQSPFLGLTRTLPRIYSTIASAGRIMRFEDIPAESSGDHKAIEPPAICAIETLVIRGVGFTYDQDKILKDVNMELRRGDFVMLSGPSGEGKTTLLRILLGLLKPDQGSIYITCSDKKTASMDRPARRLFSYVPQGNTLLSGTIEDNIRFGRPDASFEEVEQCAKVACIYDFIMELPEQFKTVVGERGLGLSEGQAQRISTARALIRGAPILLLDEATSALDIETETQLIANLRDYARDKICIFVSHKESVNRQCDKVLYIKNGELRMLA